MSDRTRIKFLRDWGPGHPAGHVEDMPSHIAEALCGGEDPFAEADQAGEYVHRAVTTTRSTVRPKRSREKTAKKGKEE